MKKCLLLLAVTLLSSFSYAQKNWFNTYAESTTLMKDANLIAEQFKADIKKIKNDSKLNIKLIHHTTPNLIYIDRDTVHLPLWNEVIPEFKQLLNQLSGSSENGKEVFGLYFNGFYLPHELAHGFQFTIQKHSELKAYDIEYFANTAAMLWWRKNGKSDDLKRCYDYAKKMMTGYPDPFPAGVEKKTYFSDRYNEIQKDMKLFAMIYPYVQFNQFIEIYEDKSLPDFDTFIDKYVKANPTVSNR